MIDPAVASGDDELCEDGDVMDSHNLTFDVCQAEELDDRSQNKNTRTSENQPEPIMADHVYPYCSKCSYM